MLTFSPFKPNDIDAVTEIENRVFETPWSAKAFLDSAGLDSFWFWVCKEDEKVVGYFVGQIASNEAELHNIAVAPEFQKKGIGRQLMEQFLSLAYQEKAGDIFLQVRESNHNAIRFYQAFGFSESGRRPSHYEGIEDALIFHKELDR